MACVMGHLMSGRHPWGKIKHKATAEQVARTQRDADVLEMLVVLRGQLAMQADLLNAMADSIGTHEHTAIYSPRLRTLAESDRRTAEKIVQFIDAL